MKGKQELYLTPSEAVRTTLWVIGITMLLILMDITYTPNVTSSDITIILLLGILYAFAQLSLIKRAKKIRR